MAESTQLTLYDVSSSEEDSRQSTLNDSSSSEADSSDDSDSVTPSIYGSVKQQQKIRRQLKIDESGKQRFGQTSSITSSLAITTGDNFFSSVSTAGFPSSNTKVQPWKKHWSHLNQTLCYRETKEMIVQCPTKMVFGKLSLFSCWWPLTKTAQVLMDSGDIRGWYKHMVALSSIGTFFRKEMFQKSRWTY